MVRLTRIYTRTGDKGQTRLGDGFRVGKDTPRVAAYGAVDEANAALGVARLSTGDDALADAMLARIQNDLFDLGADLCAPPAPGEHQGARLRVTQGQVERLEAEIDSMNAELAPLNSFVLPGGTPASAQLHVARTVVRRAECLIVTLAATESVAPEALAYANRLSDHLFVLSRWLNAKGTTDVLWVPGANR